MSVWDNTSERIAKFNAHLDVCEQCRNHPFGLCSLGAMLLKDAALHGQDALADLLKKKSSTQGPEEAMGGLSKDIEKQIGEIVKKANLPGSPDDDVFWKHFVDRINEKLPNALMTLVFEAFLETCMKDLADRIKGVPPNKGGGEHELET
jgi:hypothetical protein